MSTDLATQQAAIRQAIEHLATSPRPAALRELERHDADLEILRFALADHELYGCPSEGGACWAVRRAREIVGER